MALSMHGMSFFAQAFMLVLTCMRPSRISTLNAAMLAGTWAAFFCMSLRYDGLYYQPKTAPVTDRQKQRTQYL